jgi:hypothetical protein
MAQWRSVNEFLSQSRLQVMTRLRPIYFSGALYKRGGGKGRHNWAGDNEN